MSDARRKVAVRDSTGRQRKYPAAPVRSALMRVRASGLFPRKVRVLQQVVLLSPPSRVAQIVVKAAEMVGIICGGGAACPGSD
jgi:hypothetical protein